MMLAPAHSLTMSGKSSPAWAPTQSTSSKAAAGHRGARAPRNWARDPRGRPRRPTFGPELLRKAFTCEARTGCGPFEELLLPAREGRLRIDVREA